MQGFLVENAAIISAGVPIDTTGAAFNGDWVNMKHYRRCCIVIQQGAWAGGTPAVTLGQATSAAGGSAKALAFTRYWAGVALTDDDYLLTTVASNTFNLPNVANSVSIIEVHAQDLDHNNDFIWLRGEVASPGANADLISMMYVLYDAALAIKADDRPTVIA